MQLAFSSELLKIEDSLISKAWTTSAAVCLLQGFALSPFNLPRSGAWLPGAHSIGQASGV